MEIVTVWKWIMVETEIKVMLCTNFEQLKNQSMKYIILLGLAMFVAFGAFAQDTELETGEVDVIKSFDARLLEANIINVSPVLPPLDTTTRRQTYNVRGKSIEVEYLPPKIRPLAMKGDALQKNYNGYARFGVGTPSAFAGEAAYHIAPNERFKLDLDFRHQSANNNQNVENQRFAYTGGGLDGTYYFDQGFAVNGKLGFSSDAVHYYGYNALDENRSFDQDAVRQNFSIFDAGVSIFNGTRTAADFNYSAGLDFYFMEDNAAARENGIDIKLNGTKWFNEKHPLSITLRTDFTNYRDTSDQSLNNLYLQPNFTYHGDGFKVKVGANLASNEDNIRFFPDIELSANIVSGIVTAYVGAGGDLQKNNFRNLASYNPFISSRNDIRNTAYYSYYGGIRGTFQGFDYDIQAGFKTAEDLALYQWDQDTIAKFNVVYDTASIFTLKASATAALFEGFSLTGTVGQNIYTLDREEEAWHLPALTLNVGGRYKMMDEKLQIFADLFFENGVPYLDRQTDQAETLNALFDVSAGAEFFFTENIGIYLQLNNLANNKRERWVNYPIYGFNALFGVSARF